MNNQELVAALTKQHRTLQTDLGIALDAVLEGVDIKSGESAAALGIFKKDLEEHLLLENGTFYPALLAKMKEKGLDIGPTTKFIHEMGEIAKTVTDFLSKYKDEEAIKLYFINFSSELPEIVKALNSRIESEEEGVYETFLVL